MGDEKRWRGLLHSAMILPVSFIVFFYAFEDYWEYKIFGLYLITGFIGISIVAGCVVFGRKYRNYDTCLWFLFFFFGWLSTIYNQGVSFEYVLSHFICVWMVFLALYYAAQTISNPQKLIFISFATASIPLSMLCMCALIKASKDLTVEFPVHDKTYGCFQLGRLCASGNANALGIATATLIIVSAFCFLHSKGFLKIIFGLFLLLGWFCMGLTGCRTTMVGIAFSVGMLVLVRLYRNRQFLRTDKKILRTVVACIGAALIFFIVLKSFLLPINIYRAVMGLYGSLNGQEVLQSNLEKLVVRRITDDDGTFSDRTIIWQKCIEQSVRSMRQFLLGISPISKETIKCVYNGRHDIEIHHAHNIYIEILRRHGILGLLTIIMLICMWVKNGSTILLRSDKKASVQFLITAFYGILIMGMAEPIPFSYISCCYAAVPFFIICGYIYAEGKRRDQTESIACEDGRRK